MQGKGATHCFIKSMKGRGLRGRGAEARDLRSCSAMNTLMSLTPWIAGTLVAIVVLVLIVVLGVYPAAGFRRKK